MANAFFHLTSRKWKYDNFNPETDLSEYQNLYEEWVYYLTTNKDRGSKISETLRKEDHSKYYTKEIRDNHSKKLKGRNLIRKNKIICVETQQIFDSTILAKKWLSENNLKGDIGKCLTEKSPIFTAGGYHWAYLKDASYLESLKEFIGKERQTVQNRSRNQKKVYCIETQETFQSVKKATDKYGITIYNALKDKSKVDVNKRHWVYLEG